MGDSPAGIDLADVTNFEAGFPHEAFAEHRRTAPVAWHPATEHTPDGDGFWSVATHAETLEVLRDPATYSSEKGGHREYGGTILPDTTVAGAMFNMMDDPRHQRIRRLVSKGFTPRRIEALEDDLRARSARLVDVAVAKGECDFLVDVAMELPMQAICSLLGVPEADRWEVFGFLEPTLDFRGRGAYEPTEEAKDASARLAGYGQALIAEKRRHPGDDVLSVVVHASLDDEDPPALTDGELLMFFFLLFAAGSETTRNTIAGGVLALTEFAGQLEALRAAARFPDTAVEEMVRWTSPAAYNRRTATRDTGLRGQAIRSGDKVVFWEASANRDETVFDDAMRFDAGRDPNPHVGFGHGTHFCLGASLARMEIRVMFEELLARCRGFEQTGDPEWQRSNKHTGLRHLPLRLLPR